MITAVNPGMITWARKRSGFTQEELADVMKIDANDIVRWESGEIPSYQILEKLAYTYFNVPLALFFFPEPPDVENPVQKFRRLPEYELSRLSTDTINIIHNSASFQDSLSELIPDDFITRWIIHDIRTDGKDGATLAREARKYLGITLEQQFEFPGPEAGFKAWRHALEGVGIFTFKDSFKDRFISGFSLLHDTYPIITVNNSNAFNRQNFTLAHELGHILFGVNGITDVDTTYVKYLRDEEKTLEINCNYFASEFLVPSSTFEKDIPAEFTPELVSRLSDKYSVSREVILRKFLDYGMVSQAYYLQKAEEWNRDYLRTLPKNKGGNWYLTQLAYLGEGYTKLAYENFHRGTITIEQLGEHLHLNSKNIANLETYLEK